MPMSAGTLTTRGRAAAAALMVDACTIAHPTGTVTDDLTGAVTPTFTTVYTGPCRVQGPSGAPADVGEVQVGILDAILQVPVATTVGVDKGDRVVITACPNDTDLVGRIFYIQSLFVKTHATSRRMALVSQAT